MRRGTLAAVAALAGLGLQLAAAAGSEDALPLEQERVAREGIHSLRDAGRALKRLSHQTRKASPDYAKWLATADRDVEALSDRWASALDYFGRDFPHDALRADPERLAYARQWLEERNGEFEAQAAELQQRLLEANAGFEGAAEAADVAAAREALEAMR